MKAEDILKAIGEMSSQEKEKVFLGIMEEFNTEMETNPDFRNQAIAMMQRFMMDKMSKGVDTSAFTKIMKN